MKPAGRIVVLAEGVWDLVHYNHIEFLQDAKAFGNWLLVGVVSDKTTNSYKRPAILTEDERLRTIRALPFVDNAFVYDGPFVPELEESLIERFEVDVVVYGSPGFDDYYAPAIQRGIMQRLAYRSGLSSTEIVRRVVERHKQGLL